jgi:hypothetical protein
MYKVIHHTLPPEGSIRLIPAPEDLRAVVSILRPAAGIFLLKGSNPLSKIRDSLHKVVWGLETEEMAVYLIDPEPERPFPHPCTYLFLEED